MSSMIDVSSFSSKLNYALSSSPTVLSSSESRTAETSKKKTNLVSGKYQIMEWEIIKLKRQMSDQAIISTRLVAPPEKTYVFLTNGTYTISKYAFSTKNKEICPYFCRLGIFLFFQKKRGKRVFLRKKCCFCCFIDAPLLLTVMTLTNLHRFKNLDSFRRMEGTPICWKIGVFRKKRKMSPYCWGFGNFSCFFSEKTRKKTRFPKQQVLFLLL